MQYFTRTDGPCMHFPCSQKIPDDLYLITASQLNATSNPYPTQHLTNSVNPSTHIVAERRLCFHNPYIPKRSRTDKGMQRTPIPSGSRTVEFNPALLLSTYGVETKPWNRSLLSMDSRAILVSSTRARFSVFVTHGLPTVRISRGGITKYQLFSFFRSNDRSAMCHDEQP